MDISEESKLSLENIKRLIQRNFSENPLAWWDRNKIEATLKIKDECKYEYVRYKPIQMNMEDKKDMQMIIKEHINLGLTEPGISAYSSPGFLVRNHGEIKRGKLREHLIDCIKGAKVFSKFDYKSGFYQIKMKNESKKFTAFSTPQVSLKELAKYRKDFRPLLKETESAKWKWEEIHTQRVRELKQGKSLVDTLEGCSPNNKPKCGTSTRKSSLRFGRLLRNGLYFYLLKNSL
ncbi:UNVERIFIED_CONTAM: Enzymatic polyprotein [Sesamum angustifolium]|uniref:Enzymatic polyprotein n=1 Tax=Sesamum angustifolium TaxID=2727405 RepID=A0AAW2KYY4_9LAMI